MLTPSAQAQARSELVRGRVVDDAARAVVGASITITRAPDRRTMQAVTDSVGKFLVRVVDGSGDYLVLVVKEGYLAVRRRVEATSGVGDLVADFILRPTPVLSTVEVRSIRPVRATNTLLSGEPGTGAAERWRDGANGQVAPTLAGDIDALAGTIPGVTRTTDGFAVLGSAPSSNLTTMNGFEFPVARVPRAARLETRVTTSTYDATRGGFTGANVDVRLGPGDRNYQRRNAYLAFEPNALQWTDALGRALDARNNGLRASLGADGELVRRRLVYNVALDAERSTHGVATFGTASATVLASQDLIPDTVTAVLGNAVRLGVPTGLGRISYAGARDQLTWLGRLDDVSDSLRVLSLTTFLTGTRDDGIGLRPTATPSAASRLRDLSGGLQLSTSNLVGPGHRALLISKVAASGARVDRAPETLGANALVQMPALLDVASALGSPLGVTTVELGGGTSATRDSRWIAEVLSELYWNVRGREHRMHTALGLRAEGLHQQENANSSGLYVFPSVDAFRANRPAAYSRTLTSATRAGESWNASAAFSDDWTLSPRWSLIYGLRAEARGFLDRPQRNPALEQDLGIASGTAPTHVTLSPRIGFTYVYQNSRSTDSFRAINPSGTYTRPRLGVIRGGIGEFRDLARPGLLALSRANTGLADGTLNLSCVGAAVPTPIWQSTVGPERCLGDNGSTVRSRVVDVLDPTFDVPRVWRASLNWMTAVGALTVRVDAVGSRSNGRPSLIDQNFVGQSAFRLATEAGRLVYVPPTAIDPATAFIAPGAGRRDAAFGGVFQHRSDLAAEAGQLTFTVAPDPLRSQQHLPLLGALSYSLQQSREQYRGFDGTTGGDPRDKAWSASASDARHVIVLQAGAYHRRLGTLTTFWRFQSGLPFSPLVSADVNGDGVANDRAYIPRAGDGDTVLRAGLQSILSSVPTAIRRCLATAGGQIAARNSCRGPWSQQLNLQWTPPITTTAWGRQVSATVFVQNVLGGVDQLLHGADRLQGWGASVVPDPVLLIPRGFDPSSASYRYAVNPRFGETRAYRTGFRNPFSVVLDFSVDLSVPREVQGLRRALEPVRAGNAWRRKAADSIAAYYLDLHTGDLYRAVLSESDSLLLTRDQRASLRVADSSFVEETRRAYRALGAYLAQYPDDAVGRTALDSVQATERAQKLRLWMTVDRVGAILDPAQRLMLPLIAYVLGVPREDRLKSNFGFGFAVSLTGSPTPP